ncbi:MAG: hypothetical protein IJ099_02455 [Alphaproteobacteria bacterium]|nr:hypothetical protein [Alphaproteobacteria bacterium]
MTEYSNNAQTENKSELMQEFGFEIIYNPVTDSFILRQDGQPDIDLAGKNSIDYNEYKSDLKQELDDIFEKSLSYTIEKRDLYETLKNYPFLAAYYDMDNGIHVIEYTLKEENRESCMRILQERGLSAKEAKNTIDRLINHNNALENQSKLLHELSHREDQLKYGNKTYDLPPKYMAKLDMMSEIKANMIQAGFALEWYKKTGSLEAFDYLNCDMTEVKKALQNKNMSDEETKALIVTTVQQNWLKANNNDDSYYVEQAYIQASPQCHDYPIWAIEDNNDSQKRYHQRVMDMFQNVPKLGNVNKYINSDFQLNQNLEKNLNPQCNENLKILMKTDLQNAEQCSQNIKHYLQMIAAAYADGKLSPEESKEIATYLRGTINNRKKHNTSDNAANQQMKYIQMARMQQKINS